MKKSGRIASLCIAVVMLLTTSVITAFAAEDYNAAAAESDYTAALTTTENPETAADTTGDTTPKSKKQRGEGQKSVTRVSVTSVAASVLNMTEDEVKEAVRNAKVGDLLIAAGKVDEFKAAYLAQAKTKYDAAVAAGTLTQAQADEKYAEAQTKMAAYDGTTHLCGGTDHSKMFEQKDKSGT